MFGECLLIVFASLVFACGVRLLCVCGDCVIFDILWCPICEWFSPVFFFVVCVLCVCVICVVFLRGVFVLYVFVICVRSACV